NQTPHPVGAQGGVRGVLLPIGVRPRTPLAELVKMESNVLNRGRHSKWPNTAPLLRRRQMAQREPTAAQANSRANSIPSNGDIGIERKANHELKISSTQGR